jgi:hypothetical protein
MLILYEFYIAIMEKAGSIFYSRHYKKEWEGIVVMMTAPSKQARLERKRISSNKGQLQYNLSSTAKGTDYQPILITILAGT